MFSIVQDIAHIGQQGDCGLYFGPNSPHLWGRTWPRWAWTWVTTWVTTTYMRQSSPPASGLPRVHCVVHSGGDLHAIHTAVRVMLGAARTRTGDRRHALYRRRHTGHDMVEWRIHEAIAARAVASAATGSGGEPQPDRRRRQPQARPAPSCAVAAGRQGSRRGAPRVGTWWTRHRHVASALLCKERFTDLRFHRTDAFWRAEEHTGTYPPG